MKMTALFIFIISSAMVFSAPAAPPLKRGTVSAHSQYYDKNVTDGQDAPPAAQFPPAPSDLGAATLAPTWSRFGIGLGWSLAGDTDNFLFGGGFQLQALLSRRWGVDLFFGGAASDSGAGEPYVRDVVLFGGDIMYALRSISDDGIFPYLKIGYLFKKNSFYLSSTAESPYRTESAYDWTMGGGVQWRFSSRLLRGIAFSVNLDLSFILPNGNERDDDIGTITLLAFRFMVHF